MSENKVSALLGKLDVNLKGVEASASNMVCAVNNSTWLLVPGSRRSDIYRCEITGNTIQRNHRDTDNKDDSALCIEDINPCINDLRMIQTNMNFSVEDLVRQTNGRSNIQAILKSKFMAPTEIAK
jgi:hypothetical protein